MPIQREDSRLEITFTCEGVTHFFHPTLRWCDTEKANLERGTALGLATSCGVLICLMDGTSVPDMLYQYKDVPTRPVTCLECLARSVP